MPNQPVPTDPIESANKLALALRMNTTALNKVKNRYRAMAVFLALTVGLLLWTINARYETRQQLCQNDYDLRSGLLHVADMLESFDQPPRDPETIEFISGLRESFALPDCNRISWL